jgi:uncharacterized protein (DUF1778 family)
MTAAPRETLNMRIRSEDRNLFDWAAQAQGKTRTDFIIEAARRAAEEALLDRHVIHVGAEAYDAFVARLDSPPAPNERLARTMQTAAPWE